MVVGTKPKTNSNVKREKKVETPIDKKKNHVTELLDVIAKSELEPSFKPSMKILIRITKAMLEHGAEGKTSLSLDTKLNYTRLAKHIVWLEKKGLVKSTINKTKINVDLTERGRAFAATISNGD